MRLWRLSGTRHAHDFDGGFGLLSSGRWNTRGRRITYCSTVPSLAALEKRVHYSDFDQLPAQVMVEYEAPDDISVAALALVDLPSDWTRRETLTQGRGDVWLDGVTEALLVVPSVVMPLPDVVDRNVLINHRHPDAARIAVASVTPFTLDPRLFVTSSRDVTR